MFSSLRSSRPFILAMLLFCIGSVLLANPVTALTPEQKFTGVIAQCEDHVMQMVREERDAYRRVQFADEEPWSVLGIRPAATSDLVPYLTLNYRALDCRLRALCGAVDFATGRAGSGSLLPVQPLGCTRLFSARGRWWSPERRDHSFNELTVPECDYDRIAKDPSLAHVPNVFLTPSYFVVGDSCRALADQVLQEERQMLRLLVAQDSAQRGTRQVIGVFQAVLRDVRESFLEPLRGLVDLFGSVIHPLPCLLSQCN